MKRPTAVAAAMLAGSALYGLAPAAAQEAHGVIAVGETAVGDGVAHGIAWNFPTREGAHAEAVKACTSSGGTNCVQLAQFRNGCGALAIDRRGQANGTPGMTREQAEARALQACEVNGGAGCNIVGSTCTAPDGESQTYSGSESVLPMEGAQMTGTGPADESLTREERVLLQQTLSALGFDVGPADGVFGPRTRAVIHEWQNASGHEATGYITREQFASLTAGDALPDRELEPQQGTADDRSENVLVFGLDAGPKCAGMSEGSSCWKELADKPGCHSWDGHFVPSQTVAWSGTCREGMALGEGTLTVTDGDWSFEMTGTLDWGRPNGHWVVRFPDGDVWEGPFVDGEMHGRWVERNADGSSKERYWNEGQPE